MKTTILLVVLVMLCSVACHKDAGVDIESKHPRYSPGQVWSYKTRPHEAQSRLTILRIDKTDKVGFIVHARVDGLAIKNPTAPHGVAETISHLPFAADAIDASVVKLERTDLVPDFHEGYETWREDFDRGKAGVWKIPVAEAVSAMESVLSGKK
jgi:hypothetical protein